MDGIETLNKQFAVVLVNDEFNSNMFKFLIR